MRKFVRPFTFGKDMSPLVSDQMWLLALLAAGSFVFAMVTVFIVSMFTDIRISAWGVVGSIAPWYIAIMAGWILFVQLPLFVAHGRTREFGFRQWAIIGAILAPLGAILMAIGFLLERGIYNLAGFSFDGENEQFFSGASDLVTVTLQYLITFGVWFALGGLVGISLYRSEDWGWVSIPIAIGIASVSGAWNHTGGGLFGFVRRIVPGINYESIWLDLGLSGVAIAVGVWLIRILIHDLPLRNP